MNRKKLYFAMWILFSVLAFSVLITFYKNATLPREPDNAEDKAENNIMSKEIDEDRLLKQMPFIKEAPDFELKDLNGNTVRLSDYKGKILFINFWATWCPYCIEEMPGLEKARNEMKKEGKAEILTINIMESREEVLKYTEKEKLTLPVLLDTEGTVSYLYMGPFGINSIPVTFIINPDGTIYNIIGGATDEDTLLDYVEYIGKEDPEKTP